MRWILLIVSVLSLACNRANKKTTADTQQTDSIVSVKYTIIETSKSYVTLSDGSVKESLQKAKIKYSDKEFIVEFGNDSTWTFEIKDIQTKPEGSTFSIYDKKFKEIFITSGDLPMIIFTTHSESRNITLM